MTYYERNREKILKQTKAYKLANPLKHKMHKFLFMLRNKYKITNAQYLELFAKQENKCAICTSGIEPYTKHAHIDHCHKTGSVRGILCKSCNNGIGFLKDSVEILGNALNYLKAI